MPHKCLSSHRAGAAAALTLCLAMAGSQTSAAPAAPAQATNLERVLNLGPQQTAAQAEVGYARQQILRESAVGLGARAGLADRSREILAVLDSRSAMLDKRFNFNFLVIGQGVLPPSISESTAVVAVEESGEAMRTAAGIFRIDEPARFAMPTPTWRNWLYLGLDPGAVTVPSLGSNGPANPAEKSLWDQLVKEGYEIGRAQAQSAFELNLARLERTISGMARYYELWRRGVVTAPLVSTSKDVVVREDSKTIAVGTSLHRITRPADFQSPQDWVPLE
jgi:defect-in-organelle-trafficking protein DotC